MMASEAYILQGVELQWPYLALVFCSTVLIYSIHRVVGIRKLHSFSSEGRFATISKYRSHITIYIALSAVGVAVALYYQYSMSLIIQLLPVGLISFLYTLPLLSDHKRLRDFHYIKIFLIAIVWAYITSLPLLAARLSALHLGLYFIEKFFFILAITLPFDIRDLEIDAFGDVKTIPSVIGQKATYNLAYGLLGFGLLAFIGHWAYGFAQTAGQAAGHGIEFGFILSAKGMLLGLAIYGLTGMAIWASRGKQSDYYYSGLLDGTIIMRGLLVCLFLA